MPEDKLTAEDAKKAIESLNHLIDRVAELINYDEIGYVPTENSKGVIELQNSIRKESTLTALSQASSLIEAAADHLYALVRTLTEPMLSIAPWACARTALEACALATWLLDPKIDAKSRIARSLAFRYENLNQQAKIANLLKNNDNLVQLTRRMDDIESIALELGFERVLEKNSGKRIGVAMKMPGPTRLIGEMLNEEYAYRLLSGIAHGQYWAIRALSFKLLQDYESPTVNNSLPFDARLVERNLEPSHIIYFCSILAGAFLKTTHFATVIFGWNEEKLASIIKEFKPKFGFQDLDIS